MIKLSVILGLLLFCFSGTVFGETPLENKIIGKVNLIDKTQTETAQAEAQAVIITDEVEKDAVAFGKTILTYLTPELNVLKLKSITYTEVNEVKGGSISIVDGQVKSVPIYGKRIIRTVEEEK